MITDNQKIKIKAIVDRILNGARNPRDLDTLFLWLRSRSMGSKCVRDIGDFVAHSDERQKGFAWETASNLFKVVSQVRNTQLYKIPQCKEGLVEYKESLMANYYLDDNFHSDDKILRKKPKVKKLLENAISKMEFYDGRYQCFNLSPAEKHVMKFYSNKMIIRPAFDQKKLHLEFLQCLNRNGLAETLAIKNDGFSNFLAAYAVEKMHNCKLDFNGSKIEIYAAICKNENKNFLSATCYVPAPENQVPYGIIVSLFETDCFLEEILNEKLLGNTELGLFKFPIEFDENGKLKQLSTENKH